MLIADILRGRHSTGILHVDKDNGCSYIKNALNAAEFLETKDAYDWFLSISRSKALLGHNRAATVGSITADNAHPFRSGDINLMHNGTLTHVRGLPDSDKFAVDSAAIAHSVEQIGIEETCKRLVGAWALVWTDSSNNTINFCRNDKRPLYFARLRNTFGKKQALDKWVYASERGLLDWIVKRNGREVVNYFQLKPGVLMSFDMDGDFTSFKTSKLSYDANDEAAARAVSRVGKWPMSGARSTNTGGQSSGTRALTHSNGGSLRPKGMTRLEVGAFSSGDYVPFWPTSFELSPAFKHINQEGAQGVVQGFMCVHPYHEVRLSCVPVANVELRWNEKLTQWVLKDGEYSACLVTLVPATQHNEARVILRSGSLRMDVAFDNDDGVPLAHTAPPAKYLAGQPKFDDLENAELFHMNKMAEEEEERKVVPFSALGMVRGPGGVFITEERYIELTQEGCSNCPDPISLDDADDIAWVESDMPVCVQCTQTFGLNNHNMKRAN